MVNDWANIDCSNGKYNGIIIFGRKEIPLECCYLKKKKTKMRDFITVIAYNAATTRHIIQKKRIPNFIWELLLNLLFFFASFYLYCLSYPKHDTSKDDDNSSFFFEWMSAWCFRVFWCFLVELLFLGRMNSMRKKI